MKLVLEKLINNQSLSTEEAYQSILKIGNGEVNSSQIAAFLVLMPQKGITPEELSAFRKGMIEMSIGPDLSVFDAMDVCGTGGDGKDTFNISTTAAFVVAGSGQKIAKHGNQGVSSAVGSSTVLEYLGVNFTNDSSFLTKKIEKANICYLHAPLFHPAMKFVGGIRKDLGLRTFFNILGPLINPGKVKKQLTGVSDLKTFDLYQQVFLQSGNPFGVVHSLDIYDEISLTSDFKFANSDGARVISPSDLGFEKCGQEELHGGATLADSAQVLLDVLQNKGTKPQENAVLANAGLAISIGKSISIADGILAARESLESGKAYDWLKILIEK